MKTKRQRGGSRPGSGRKSKAELIGFTGMLDERLSPEKWNKVIDNLYKFAAGSNAKAAVAASTLLLSYRFGKPTEKHEVGGEGGGPVLVRVVYDSRA